MSSSDGSYNDLHFLRIIVLLLLQCTKLYIRKFVNVKCSLIYSFKKYRLCCRQKVLKIHSKKKKIENEWKSKISFLKELFKTLNKHENSFQTMISHISLLKPKNLSKNLSKIFQIICLKNLSKNLMFKNYGKNSV